MILSRGATLQCVISKEAFTYDVIFQIAGGLEDDVISKSLLGYKLMFLSAGPPTYLY